MAESTFGERLQYALFLFEWNYGRELTQTELAKRVERTQPAVKAWLERDEPPTDYRVHDPLAAAVETPKAWLLEGKGSAPDPELWGKWLSRRRRLTKHAPIGAFKEASHSTSKRKRKGA